MYFVLFGTDKPGMCEIRERIRPEHRVYLREPGSHPVRVVIGGPTLSDDQQMNGTLLVVEADSLKDVEAFVCDDPYTKIGLFESLTIRPWVWGLGAPEMKS